MAEPPFDPALILATLDRHRVDYVLVGGLAARAHGATRPTADIDCVPSDDHGNLERLAAALRELGARLRVGGLTDDEARQLPIELDAATLRAFGSSTWMTDSGPIDVLRELRDRQGRDVAFGVLRGRSVDQEIGGIVVHVARLDDVIAAKEHADRPKDRDIGGVRVDRLERADVARWLDDLAAKENRLNRRECWLPQSLWNSRPTAEPCLSRPVTGDWTLHHDDHERMKAFSVTEHPRAGRSVAGEPSLPICSASAPIRRARSARNRGSRGSTGRSLTTVQMG